MEGPIVVSIPDPTVRPLAPAAGEEILVVDLDGTLIRGDLLWEGLARLVFAGRLASILRLPIWLLGGLAHLKTELASHVSPDPRGLPYRRAVVERIQRARSEGRRVILASASPSAWVEAIAAHLGCIDQVLATSPVCNLKGREKVRAIRGEIGDAPFAYIGNSRADIPIWAEATTALTVSPMGGRGLGKRGETEMEQLDSGEPSPLAALVAELRPHQWAKNALVLAPVMLAHQFSDSGKILAALLGFALFSAVASGGYILNDLIDLEDDRRHPSKKKRPLASGTLPIPLALAGAAVLVLGALVASILWTSPAVTAMLILYITISVTYSLYLKKILLLDVLVLAGLYTHRILTGGIVADVPVSPWLLVFSAFLFLSLAFVKRFIELTADRNPAERGERPEGAYESADVRSIEGMGLASAFIAVLVLCLFVSSPDVSRLYSSPILLWGMCPVMLYWIGRIWLLARRQELDADPVLFAMRDRNSYIAGAVILAIVAVAAIL